LTLIKLTLFNFGDRNDLDKCSDFCGCNSNDRVGLDNCCDFKNCCEFVNIRCFEGFWDPDDFCGRNSNDRCCCCNYNDRCGSVDICCFDFWDPDDLGGLDDICKSDDFFCPDFCDFRGCCKPWFCTSPSCCFWRVRWCSPSSFK